MAVVVFILDLMHLKFLFYEIKRNYLSVLMKHQGLIQTHHGDLSFLLFHAEDAGSDLDGGKGL